LTLRLAPELHRSAAELLGADPFPHATEGTIWAQPAIFCESVAGWRALHGELSPEAIAGHSLGEFAALVAAGSLDPEEALRLVVLRGKLAQRAADAADGGGMLALLGRDMEGVEELVRAAGATVANINSPSQLVASGSDECLSRLRQAAKERGCSAIMLNTRIPFHSRAMEAVLPEFAEALAKVEVREPQVPVLSGIDGSPFVDIREQLAAALVKPVRWWEVLTALKQRGIEILIEPGPGNVLTKLAKRAVPELTCLGPSAFGARRDSGTSQGSDG
jgi:malonyl CoA-acyl carrier protein transacylase